MRYFRTIRDAHEHYEYPGSYQHGSIVDPDTGTVLRSYSASSSSSHDYVPREYRSQRIPPVFYYAIKTPRIRAAYKKTIYATGAQGRVRLFLKQHDGRVLDAGLYRPERFYKGHVKLRRVNTSLYEDANPNTTIAGTGFRDESSAKRTLALIRDRPVPYQKQVILTMYHRAKYHPYQTNGMRDAMRVYSQWLTENNIHIQ